MLRQAQHKFFMRLIFFILLFFILTLTVKSQSWYPCNAPFNLLANVSPQVLETIDSNLYIGGGFHMYIGGVETYNIAKWNGFKWDSLGIGAGIDQNGNFSGGDVRAIKKFKGEIYAAGEFRYAGYLQSPQISKFNGTSWEAVNTIYLSPLDKIRAMEIYNDKLVVVGSFDSLGNSNNSIYSNCCIAQWDSSSWSLFPGGDLNGSANSSILFNDELYVSGNFEIAGGVTVFGIGRWDGNVWKSCGLGSTTPVFDMIEDTVNNKLYMLAGDVINSDSTTVLTNGVARWNGQKWEEMPLPLNPWGKYCLEIYHGKLYTGAADTPRFSAFDGKTWEAIDYVSNTVMEMGIYKDTLFVAGFFSYIVDTNGDTIDAPYLVRYWTPNYCDSIHSFTLSLDTVYISDSTVVQFAPTGFANQYQWDFGTSSTGSDTAALQSHYFDSAGVNTIKLIATYGLCPWDTVIKTVTVIDDCQQTIITVPDTVVKNTVIQFTGNNPEATQWQWFLGSTQLSDSSNAIYFFDSAGTYTVTVTTNYKNCYDTVTATVVVVNALGVEEKAVSSERLKIYPNPAGGSFTVEVRSRRLEAGRMKLEIYDVKGKLVYQSEITSSKVEIPSKSWTRGNYFVNLVLEGKTVAKEKVVVK